MFDSPIQYLKGVGEKRAQLFYRLGVYTVGDLLTLYPRTYEDWSKISPIAEAPFDQKCCVRAVITKEPVMRMAGTGRKVFSAMASDGHTALKIVIYNNVYIAKRLKEGKAFLFFGKVGGKFTLREMISPEIAEDGENNIYAVYPQTSGLSFRTISKCVAVALEKLKGTLVDPLPAVVREQYGLCGYAEALQNIHFPESWEALDSARNRLVFDELLLLSLGMQKLRDRDRALTGVKITRDFSKEFFGMLPFIPTAAQRRAVAEAILDLSKEIPMRRLIQGDVGSGKTAVAAAVCHTVIQNGWQAALMAPTEILASQHFSTFIHLFDGTGIHVGLLTGSMTAKVKKEVYEKLKSGEIDLIVGTHALIQEKVEFARLGLVITDEQHRFGVEQRSLLAGKGENPHLLVMSATPIPRTLSLIIYGDLELSVLDEMPPGRQPIETYLVTRDLHTRACAYVRRHLDEGRQGYFVCPLVEEGEHNFASAEKYAETLAETEFRNYTVGLLHGRMKAKEKEEVMNRFASGQIQVLVSTTVIEVGVDVPNAVIMVIENAERFGLSQLHQLRGRIGRGKYKSTCILVSDASGETARQRLKILCDTTDGFKIADEDLKLRGPGDFFGSRQHGLPELKIADMAQDTKLVTLAAKAAKEIYRADPELAAPENTRLSQLIKGLFETVDNGKIS